MDTNKRFRRTNRMIEIDNYLTKQFQNTIDWASLSHVEVLQKLDQYAHVAAEPVATPMPVPKQFAELNGFTTKPVDGGGIKFEPVDNEIEPAPITLNVLKHSEIIELAAASATNVVATAMRQFEAKLNEVAATVRPRQVIAAIKVNDQPAVKIKDGAHPLLAEVMRLSYALRPLPRSVLLVGPGGSGKTLIGKQFGEALNLPVTIIPMSQGVSEAHLHGRFTPTGWQPGVFAKAYSQPGIIVIDEFDAADENAGLSLNAPLSGETYTNPMNGETVTRHKDCHIIATANTCARGGDAIYSARTRLDGSTVDRFLLVEVTYLQSVEDQLLTNPKLVKDLRDLRNVIQTSGAMEFVGYRAFQTVQALDQAGYSRDQILSLLTFPYSPDLKEAVVRDLQFKAT